MAYSERLVEVDTRMCPVNPVVQNWKTYNNCMSHHGVPLCFRDMCKCNFTRVSTFVIVRLADTSLADNWFLTEGTIHQRMIRTKYWPPGTGKTKRRALASDVCARLQTCVEFYLSPPVIRQVGDNLCIILMRQTTSGKYYRRLGNCDWF